MSLLRPSTSARDALTGACEGFLTPIHQKFGELLSLVVAGVIQWDYFWGCFFGDRLVDSTNQNFFGDVICLMSTQWEKPARNCQSWNKDETNGQSEDL